MKNKQKQNLENSIYNIIERWNIPHNEKEAWMEMIVWGGKDTTKKWFTKEEQNKK